MKKKHYKPSDAEGILLWLGNFSDKLDIYAEKYGISAEEVADMKKAVAYLAWVLNCQNISSEFSVHLTAYKNEMLKGVLYGATSSVAPTSLNLPTPPEAVAPNILGRISALAARIKNLLNYTI
ncbi:MAG: hypothetical protein ACRC0V_12925, partial [Fusobacteriaceae bacterium]